MTLDPDVFLRDNVVQGDPGTDFFDPIKSQMRQWMKSVSRIAAGNTVNVATLAELNAITGSANQGGMVWGDSTGANNGVYAWDATSSPAAWVRIAALPHTAAVLTNIAGTANAITADTETGVDPAEVQLLVMPDPPGTNLAGAVTLRLNGGALEDIKSSSGSNPAAGAIIDGVGTVFFRYGIEWRQLVSSAPGATLDFQGAWDSGTTYTQSQFVTNNNRMYYLIDVSSTNEEPGASSPDPWLLVFDFSSLLGDGSVTVVKTAFLFDTVASVEAATISGAGTTVKFVETTGYTAANDGGGARYAYVAAEPAHDGKIQSADGAWWEVSRPHFYAVRNVGAKGDGVEDDHSALQDALDAAAEEEGTSGTYSRILARVRSEPGNFLIGSGKTLRLKKSARLAGAGRGQTWFTHGGGSAPMFDTDSAASDNIEIDLADFTLIGAGASTTYGILGNDMIRNANLRNVNVFNCNINVQLEDCWTYFFDRCNLFNAVLDNLVWNNATCGVIQHCRIDSAGRNNILVDASAYNTVNLNLFGSYSQFAGWYGLNIASASSMNIYGGYFEGNNQDDGSRADIVWASDSDEGVLLNIFGSYFSSSNGSGATSRAIYQNGRIMNLHGCNIYSGGSGYSTTIRSQGNAEVLNLVGCNMPAAPSVLSGVVVNNVGSMIGSARVGAYSLGSASELTISSGAITVSRSTHLVDTESNAATDNLDTINGGYDGMIITLRSVDSARDVVVKHNTGNIKIGSGADFTLSTNIKSITLQYCADLGAGAWVQLASA